MSGTRKILLALSILFGLLGLFRVYAVATDDHAESQARDRARQVAELRALEAGQPPPGEIVAMDEHARARRIDDLRAWTKSHAAQEALEAEDQRRHWLLATLMLLIASGLGVTVLLAGRKDGPRVIVRLGQLRAGVTAAALVGLLSGAVFLGTATEAVEQHQAMVETEHRLVELKRKLETFEFDRNGNVPADKNLEFSMLMTEARLLPDSLAQLGADRTMCALISLAALAAMGLSFYFGRRSWRASPTAPEAAVSIATQRA